MPIPLLDCTAKSGKDLYEDYGNYSFLIYFEMTVDLHVSFTSIFTWSLLPLLNTRKKPKPHLTGKKVTALLIPPRSVLKGHGHPFVQAGVGSCSQDHGAARAPGEGVCLEIAYGWPLVTGSHWASCRPVLLLGLAPDLPQTLQVTLHSTYLVE